MAEKRDGRPSSEEMIRRARERLGSDPSDPSTRDKEETSIPAGLGADETDRLDIDEYIESLRSGETSFEAEEERPSDRVPEPDVDSSHPTEEPEPMPRTIPIRYEPEPVPDLGREIPKELPDSTRARGRRRWLGQLAWLLVIAFFVFNRCGTADNLFGDPAGEQLIDAFEQQFKAAGLSDDTWDCIESGMRNHGYVEDLNEVSVADVEAALESPENPPPPELTQFIAGLQIQMNPNQPSSCMSAEEAASLNLVP